MKSMTLRKRVLLVDDETPVREALGRVFGLEQYDVVAVATGREAMATFDGAEIDLAVLDLTLAAESGWDTVRELIALNPALPVIVITARPDQGSLPLAKRVAAVMEKPLDLPLLLATVSRLLSQLPIEKIEKSVRAPRRAQERGLVS
jgi:DNA-binding response OmpR family regulator